MLYGESVYTAMKDLFPGSSVRELIVSAQPGWNAFNPSIAFSPEEGYRCIVRSSNYVLDAQGRYNIKDPAGTIRTRNLIATMDSNLDIIDLQMIQPCSWGPVLFPLVRGLEDARLYWEKDHWQVYGNLREHRTDGLPTIVTARLDHDALIKPEVYDNFGLCQKNWMVMGEGPHFIYLCNPPATIHHGVYRTEPHDKYDSESEAFRGSSQALSRGSGYIAVTHEVNWETGNRRYFHRFCMFDLDGYLTSYTPPFYFVFDKVVEDLPMIEYAAGLVEHGGDFVISFGFQDARAFLARIPISNVVSAMHPAKLA